MYNHGKLREVTGSYGKSREITGKLREITGNHGKLRENYGKSREITGNHGVPPGGGPIESVPLVGWLVG